ncbi:Bromodomain containing protein [Trichomonas vaginalis G3]|uniref:Bromodomain containing protein n=1 Tax=Trichomonas vaginalis (strain ATCC PRA-98 / G3) TaxID=412133 RepID=A2DB45_TRIV3|nr:chromatin organization [Trichomonas vaginalis G3]EAY22375.1 Bromodomain containing protein [Trichomonas vaginalis G3]KAI5517698.1 chromatin organization [Trichomonas vaginalis G3]|eukprot:XP_001583361.1 Bromodomain containing protein [Trichomonas vaginalis G3]
MTLTKFQVDKCAKLIEKLLAKPICLPFIDLVDPDKDGAPDYLQIIKEPMSLHEVQKKLKNNSYSTIDQFVRDVNLIWSNAKEYNGADTLFSHMAMEAKIWFDGKMKQFSNTPEEEWTRKIQRTTQKLLEVLQHPPAELDPSGKLAHHEGEAPK